MPSSFLGSIRPSQQHDLDAVQVLDRVIQLAVSTGASDIHFEPKRKTLKVRFRIDGVMVDQGSLPLELGPALLTRVKVLGRMDMTIRRLPQDGQFSLELSDGLIVHLRASTFPAIHGETLVMRALMSHQLIPMDQLGMDDDELFRLQRLTTLQSGLIIACGPTGSGKTSTLYSMLQQLDTTNLSVVTLEDPIEVEFPEVTQGQTNNRAGFSFAAGLRAILRQDPDVILVGEMRDSETAQIGLQASLTGHLVMSTLHTSDTVETIARIVDLGAEPWIVGNALQAVIAQRLVRTLCPKCCEEYPLANDIVADPTGSEAAERIVLRVGQKVMKPKGCAACHGTGYAGRTGIFEVLEVDDDLRDLIRTRGSTRDYRQHLDKIEGRKLREIGLMRVAEGKTSLAEVLRVT
ncbi:MAG: type II/IV secretion system protein [Deltaproteobacteria bacterium]|nr:type II/IV secretion system protein [Deltaproteobacteria bacterium]